MRYHMNDGSSTYPGWRTLFSMELQKLFHGKLFWAALGCGFLIVLLNTLYMVDFEAGAVAADVQAGGLENPYIYSYTLYNRWIGNESFSFSFSMYYFLFPVLCALPYGWSLSSEIRGGYLKNIAVRAARKSYFSAKICAASLGGGLACTIPLLLNFITDAMFIPAVKPDLLYPFYMVMQADFLADLYVTHPLLFNLLFMAFTFLFTGLAAGCVSACVFLAHGQVAAFFAVPGVFYFLHYISSMLPYPAVQYSLSPLYCIHPTPVGRHSSGLVLFGYMGAMLLFLVAVIWAKGNRRYEVY